MCSNPWGCYQLKNGYSDCKMCYVKMSCSYEYLEVLFSRPAPANRTFFKDGNILYMQCANMVATQKTHSYGNVVSATKEVHF